MFWAFAVSGVLRCRGCYVLQRLKRLRLLARIGESFRAAPLLLDLWGFEVEVRLRKQPSLAVRASGAHGPRTRRRPSEAGRLVLTAKGLIACEAQGSTLRRSILCICEPLPLFAGAFHS